MAFEFIRLCRSSFVSVMRNGSRSNCFQEDSHKQWLQFIVCLGKGDYPLSYGSPRVLEKVAVSIVLIVVSKLYSSYEVLPFVLPQIFFVNPIHLKKAKENN